MDNELDDDAGDLKQLLGKLPIFSNQLKNTAEEMILNSGHGDDYFERREELDEQVEELDEIKEAVERHKELFVQFKSQREQSKKSLPKNQSLEGLQKTKEQLLSMKNDLTNLFTEALDSQDQLNDIKSDLGDCDIPKLIAKRKKEFQQFNSKLERIKKDVKNLKTQTSKQQDPEQKIGAQIKEVEFKLKGLDNENLKIQKAIREDLDPLQPVDFDDFEKNAAIVSKVRHVKEDIHAAENKLKDLEEIKNDLMKKLTEQDMENSTDLLLLNIKELRNRLEEAKKHIQKITKTGNEMDGNTSCAEEDDFIVAMKKEMPEFLDNIETTFKLLDESEKLGVEVKQTLDSSKMSQLMENVNISQQNVEECEVLVNKLEKEIVEWNAQKKLCKRDKELEDVAQQCSEIIEDLIQEKQNTEVELDKNREKQEENRGQEMVDKDGNKVDIMEDLIKLEGQMGSYIEEIDALVEEVRKVDTVRDGLFEDFNSKIPGIVKDLRKKRHHESNMQTKAHLKRPPMLKKETVR